MGQHKTNPIAIAASEGKLEVKPDRIDKRELERYIEAKAKEYMIKKNPQWASLILSMNPWKY